MAVERSFFTPFPFLACRQLILTVKEAKKKSRPAHGGSQVAHFSNKAIPIDLSLEFSVPIDCRRQVFRNNVCGQSSTHIRIF